MTAPFMSTHVPTLLARLSHRMDEDFHAALYRRGVPMPEFRALAALRDAMPEGQTVTRLADLCMLRQPTMTKLLDRMVRKGLAVRRGDPRDRRKVRVALSVRGALLADELVALAWEFETGLSRALPALDSTGLRVGARAYLGEEV